MVSKITILVGFNAMLGSVMGQTPKLLCANSTLNLTHPVNATACAQVPPLNSTTTQPGTIYTSSPDSLVPPPVAYLYRLTASVDPYQWTYSHRRDWRAHYSFVFAIEPDYNAMECHASVHAPHGNLADVKVARCQQDNTWAGAHNYTAPARFAFAWMNRANGTVLVLRSTNPASAGRCPDFPHDACWAQALYWVPPGDLASRDGAQVYVGRDDLYVAGTYCKGGMPGCAWSEYLY